MLILTNKQKEELNKINEENSHLHRALSPIKVGKKWGLGIDLLEDETTWGNWIDFLKTLPEKDVR